MIYSASSSQPFLQQQSAAMQPPWTLEGAVPIMTDGQLSGGQCVMYGLQGPQAMQQNSQAGGAAFAAQFQGPQQPFSPQQLQMLQQAYGTPQHPLVQQTPEGSRQTSPELSVSCGITGMDQPGMA